MTKISENWGGKRKGSGRKRDHSRGGEKADVTVTFRLTQTEADTLLRVAHSDYNQNINQASKAAILKLIQYIQYSKRCEKRTKDALQ